MAQTRTTIEQAISILGFHSENVQTWDDLVKYAKENKQDVLQILAKQYRKRSRTVHPDKNPSKSAEEEFKNLTHNYELLREYFNKKYSSMDSTTSVPSQHFKSNPPKAGEDFVGRDEVLRLFEAHDKSTQLKALDDLWNIYLEIYKYSYNPHFKTFECIFNYFHSLHNELTSLEVWQELFKKLPILKEFKAFKNEIPSIYNQLIVSTLDLQSKSYLPSEPTAKVTRDGAQYSEYKWEHEGEFFYKFNLKKPIELMNRKNTTELGKWMNALNEEYRFYGLIQLETKFTPPTWMMMGDSSGDEKNELISILTDNPFLLCNIAKPSLSLEYGLCQTIGKFSAHLLGFRMPNIAPIDSNSSMISQSDPTYPANTNNQLITSQSDQCFPIVEINSENEFQIFFQNKNYGKQIYFLLNQELSSVDFNLSKKEHKFNNQQSASIATTTNCKLIIKNPFEVTHYLHEHCGLSPFFIQDFIKQKMTSTDSLLIQMKEYFNFHIHRMMDLLKNEMDAMPSEKQLYNKDDLFKNDYTVKKNKLNALDKIVKLLSSYENIQDIIVLFSIKEISNIFKNESAAFDGRTKKLIDLMQNQIQWWQPVIGLNLQLSNSSKNIKAIKN